MTRDEPKQAQCREHKCLGEEEDYEAPKELFPLNPLLKRGKIFLRSGEVFCHKQHSAIEAIGCIQKRMEKDTNLGDDHSFFWEDKRAIAGWVVAFWNEDGSERRQ